MPCHGSCMIRRARSFPKSRGSKRVGSGDGLALKGRNGSAQEVFKYHGSVRVTLTVPVCFFCWYYRFLGGN